MKYETEIQGAIDAPEQLENLYQLSRQSNEEAEFRADLVEDIDTSRILWEKQDLLRHDPDKLAQLILASRYLGWRPWW